jgi:nucleoside-triphosphatase
VQVSKYGVAVDELERVGVQALRGAHERGYVMVVDEIGRMQLFSRAFRQMVLSAIKEGHPLLGTIMAGRNPYADRIKAERHVELLVLTEDNRHEILDLLRAKFV